MYEDIFESICKAAEKRNLRERAGFNAGDKITVDCQKGRLVITKDEPKQILERDNRQILIFYERLL